MTPEKIYVHDFLELGVSNKWYTKPYCGSIAHKDYEYVRSDMLLKEDNANIREAAKVLVDSVEKYVRQECSRSTLLSMKDKLKELLEK